MKATLSHRLESLMIAKEAVLKHIGAEYGVSPFPTPTNKQNSAHSCNGSNRDDMSVAHVVADASRATRQVNVDTAQKEHSAR